MVVPFGEPFNWDFIKKKKTFPLQGQLLDHTIKFPNEGMSGFTLMFKFLDLTELMQYILTAIYSGLMLSFLCGIQNGMNFAPVFGLGGFKIPIHSRQ